MESAVLELRGIRKAFPGVVAVDGVDLSVHAGEVHALVGENGAGKSTIAKIMTGIILPEDGTLVLEGEAVRIGGPREAREMGIAIAHQEIDLFPHLSVAENICAQVGMPGPRWWIRWSEARRRATRALDDLETTLPVRAPVGALSPAERAGVQIAAAMLDAPRILVLDEPTASLSAEEAEPLFARIEDLRDEGTAVVYITHRLSEVFRIAQRVTVLRDGRKVWTRKIPETGPDEVIRAMVGRTMDTYCPRPGPPGEGVLLEVESLTDRGRLFRDVSLSLRPGEILGIYGLVGSGRSELAQAIAGLRPCRGRVRCGRHRGPFSGPRESMAAGIAYLPGDRWVEGNLPDLSVRENLSISSIPTALPFYWVARGREDAMVRHHLHILDIRVGDPERPVSTLSGGNQQKVLLGRALSLKPEVLILDEPTRGIDVGARAEIHRIVGDLARAGHGVLLISSDLPEIKGMSHRVAVFSEGRMVKLLDEGASEEEIARAAIPAEESRAAGAAERGRIARRSLPREVVLLVAIGIVVGAMALYRPDFLAPGTLMDIIKNNAPLIVASIGMTLVISSRGIDISIGSILAIGATCGTAWVMLFEGTALGSTLIRVPSWDFPVVRWLAWLLLTWEMAVALIVAIAAGGALGLLNGVISVAGRIHPIVVTLGTLAILRAGFLIATGGEWINVPPSLLRLAEQGILGIPVSVLGAAVVLIVATVITRWTRMGRMCLQAGDNPHAARTCGIPVGLSRLFAFAFLGGCMGLAGIFYVARFGEIQSNTGEGYELEVIAASVIGGARLEGGRGNPIGATLGALFVGLTSTVRYIFGVHDRWQLAIVGGLLLGAMSLETVLGRIAGGRR